ncbi:MAG: hypothetical protein A2722_01635 [Candidatus Doudnabacteria bacterium RIFCSPHIGHO2_01_FULL_50_11]|uniref:Uncharacterized protein n=1 Tax=Candidatus Doudnabacteria bacterium RIFCSPHIGHO2_01_FULL_50_11 TaxID=1817828 RepID=A0A1F5PEB0_9BACT|nr:MAG: hypothetical protein A2722_01635 [Candidatus Doudnabacteria bacterium RIFCSPHIGHO2_01_FULL_50_11]HLC44310.1 hypothetical protein [Patescibacteria group bacterium]
MYRLQEVRNALEEHPELCGDNTPAEILQVIKEQGGMNKEGTLVMSGGIQAVLGDAKSSQFFDVMEGKPLHPAEQTELHG